LRQLKALQPEVICDARRLVGGLLEAVETSGDVVDPSKGLGIGRA
jgi:hypothetical protein